MEALSGAASGIAVISLAIQLSQSVALIREFVRDVKGASKELERLVGKLELLNALLEDAQKILEKQLSLQSMHFPAPSMAIFKCLQSCENSIKPLMDTVKKFTPPQSQLSSATARLKNEVKIGLKTKEILTLETRIQHDIDLLTSALSMNQNGIFMDMFPILLRNQETMMKNHAGPYVEHRSCSSSGSNAARLDTVASFAPPPHRYSQQTILVRSTFERLGLSRRKVIRYHHSRTEELEGNAKSCKKEILWTADELSMMWAKLGFGLTFTRQHPYGRIFPSLSTYPVGQVGKAIADMIVNGSVRDLQKKFSSGALHPFLRDPKGFSLLHSAALARRPDMCRLLLGYGVKPELTLTNESPISLAMTDQFWRGSPAEKIDTYRCFLDEADLVDEFIRADSGIYASTFGFTIDEAQWLWRKNSELLVGDDLRTNQRMIIRRFWCSIANATHFSNREYQFPNIAMDIYILSDIQHGYCQILPALMTFCREVTFSYILGAWFLDWLVALGLEPELCVAHERAQFERSRPISNQRIVFERNWDQKWVLGFEWVLDRQAPGYTLISEYTTLIVEARASGWPFAEWKGWSTRSMNVGRLCFNRRMAAKERKERARLGQKQPRIRRRMPGAWEW